MTYEPRRLLGALDEFTEDLDRVHDHITEQVEDLRRHLTYVLQTPSTELEQIRVTVTDLKHRVKATSSMHQAIHVVHIAASDPTGPRHSHRAPLDPGDYCAQCLDANGKPVPYPCPTIQILLGPLEDTALATEPTTEAPPRRGGAD